MINEKTIVQIHIFQANGLENSRNRKCRGKKMYFDGNAAHE